MFTFLYNEYIISVCTLNGEAIRICIRKSHASSEGAKHLYYIYADFAMYCFWLDGNQKRIGTGLFTEVLQARSKLNISYKKTVMFITNPLYLGTKNTCR